MNITGLTGESINVPYSPHTTVDQLKNQIQIKLKHDKGKQKLLYEGKEMNVSSLLSMRVLAVLAIHD